MTVQLQASLHNDVMQVQTTHTTHKQFDGLPSTYMVNSASYPQGQRTSINVGIVMCWEVDGKRSTKSDMLQFYLFRCINKSASSSTSVQVRTVTTKCKDIEGHLSEVFLKNGTHVSKNLWYLCFQELMVTVGCA